MHRGRWVAVGLILLALLGAWLVGPFGPLGAPPADEVDGLEATLDAAGRAADGTPADGPELAAAPGGEAEGPPSAREADDGWLLRDPEEALHVRVLTDDGRPAVGATVEFRTLLGIDSPEEDTTDVHGCARFPSGAAQVTLYATHPTHGVGTGFGYAPGRVEIRLRQGPEVLVDASAIPEATRGKLRVLQVVTLDPSVVPHEINVSLGDGTPSLGRWPPGCLTLQFGPDPWHMQSMAVALPTTDRVVVPLTWDDTRDGARLSLEGHQGAWTLIQRKPPAGRIDDLLGDRERLEADVQGIVHLPWGLPRGACRADVPGECPRWFDPANLPRDEQGRHVVPADEGCRCQVILEEPLGFHLQVEVHGFSDAARRDLDLVDDDVAFGRVIAGHEPRRDMAWLTEIPAFTRGRRELLVPSHAVIRCTGCGPDRQVRMTMRTGAPGTALEVRPRTDPCASLHLEGCSPTLHEEDAWGFAISTLRGRGEHRDLVIEVQHGISGDALVEGLPVPFEGELAVTNDLRCWRFPVRLDMPGKHTIRCRDRKEDAAGRYELRVRTPAGDPVPGAVVRWLQDDGFPLVTSRTDARGLAVLEAAGPWDMAELVARPDGSRETHFEVLEGPGSYEVTLEPLTMLAVTLGSAHEGHRRRIRVLHEDADFPFPTILQPLVLGATTLRLPLAGTGRCTVTLLDDTGEELARRDVELLAGKTSTVQFD